MKSFIFTLLLLGLSRNSFASVVYDDRIVISIPDYESSEDLSIDESECADNNEFIQSDNNEGISIEDNDDGSMLTDDNNINDNEVLSNEDNDGEDMPTDDNNINNNEVLSNEDNEDEDMPTDTSIGEAITTDMAANPSATPLTIYQLIALIRQEITKTHHSGTKRYKLIKKKMNFFKAMEYCSLAGTRLATFSSEEEYDQLTREIKMTNRDMSQHFWVGATDLGETNTYKWLSTGRELTYTRWHSGEPSHHGYLGYHGYGYDEIEHCVEITARFNYDMNDGRCSDEQQFVCENPVLV